MRSGRSDGVTASTLLHGVPPHRTARGAWCVRCVRLAEGRLRPVQVEKKDCLLGLGGAPTAALRTRALEWSISGAVKLQDFFYVISRYSTVSTVSTVSTRAAVPCGPLRCSAPPLRTAAAGTAPAVEGAPPTRRSRALPRLASPCGLLRHSVTPGPFAMA